MNLNPDFVNLFSEITSKAAAASFSFVGQGDKNKADEAANLFADNGQWRDLLAFLIFHLLIL